ncbi:transcriptional regulator with XRE-family HTH domain [Kitasatospora gansuensis]|uniref:Transcriptional regulator with XRE-family HTH domain n=1 Tax=Kitasatospora gansuensis TaxID=258050 RepID=A0A7W7WHC1_9ACTN|nr:helix-turn-helix transcriptional regulator [Kitasatospora gansuensis]MBB4946545.1 transcriptional regulator with XRE-family HTH domain [Kitasatospora gansuensis]
MTTTSTETGAGALLRDWRERRGLSQLQLALGADSSARHISFIETGRSRPGQDLLLRLAEHLDIPVRERNSLLLAAGYAPHYAETPLDDPALDALRSGMEQLLAAHEPYPALIVDGTYRVLAANRGIALLLDGVDPALLAPPMNAMRITLHPQGLAPRIRNLRQWRAHLLEQMERQIALVRSEPLRALYEEVHGYPVPAEDESQDASALFPFALPLRFEHGGRVLSFLSTISTFNTPMDVTVSELAMETFLPADPETASYLREVLP